jgi:hypothetical protein
MIPAGQTGRRTPKSDSTALALLIGMVLAVGVSAAASFSAAGSGALQQTLRTLGFGRETEIQAVQRKQATALAEFERLISRMDNEIGALTTRVTRSESNEAALGERVARLDGGLAALGTDVKELRAQSEAAATEAWRKPVDHLTAAVTGARSDIITLRSSIDAYDQLRRNDIGAIMRRIDRLEQAIAAREATASIPNSAPRSEEPSSGLMGLFGLRGSTPAEPRSGHVMDVSPPSH